MQADVNSPFFSVHTPTYKRVGYLRKLWEALCNQTYKNFEWIVADDGSNDGTLELLKELKKQSPFPVTIIAASKRVGKTVLDNSAIKIAKGEIFIWNDSDDVLLPDTLESICNAWNEISPAERKAYCGITALCEENGRIIESPLPFATPFDTTWIDLKYKYKVTGDLFYTCRIDVLRSYLPPEVDFYMAESAYRIPIASKYKTRIIDKVATVKEYKSSNCISFSGKMEYCRGYLYAMSICWRVLSNENQFGLSTVTLKERANYFRYAIHGDLGMTKAYSMFPSRASFLLTILVLPFAFVLALKDKAQGKVFKTHLEFNNTIESSTISYL